MPESFNILCVDDDKDFCDLITVMLRYADTDYKLTAVATPQEALDLLAHKSFDLFMFDYNLPHMTGVELCRRIRSTDSKTPIVFYTGTSEDDDRRAALEAGANAYLIKPNDIDNIVATIKNLLNN
ncbi:MAG TPA: response regulator [Pyrinomonadaceae bacterium]|nr:response regulator [Pyrinomonadaceae bacterium]